MPTDIPVCPNTPMPKGYAFLPKGIVYKTLHCRKLTHASTQPLYIVTANKKTLGLRAPAAIIAQVHSLAASTLPTRRANTQKRDAQDLAKADASLSSLFPAMPAQEKALVLNHGFRKHSGRVGRSGAMPLERKVVLAVIAHVRHRHSAYDGLLREGVERGEARRVTRGVVEGVVRGWGYEDGGKTKKAGKTGEKGKGKGKGKRALKREVSSSPELFDCDDSMDEDYV